MLLFMS